jgi:hypothetical protein
MNVKKLVSAIATCGLIAAAASATTAHAAYVVLDGWEMETSTGSTDNIGRLNLVSGTATVEQEVDGTGNVFVGARFLEDGTIYSISYTEENVVGAGDFGAPQPLHIGFPGLTISFFDVEGVVTSLLGTGGFEYSFTSGTFVIDAGAGDTASGSIVGIGGNAASTDIIGGINGDSTILATILSTTGVFNFYDNLGALLNPGFLTGEFLFQAVTNNNLTSVLGSGLCSFDGAASCITFSVASAGDAYIVQRVPEPATLALLGIGLLGIGASLRRRKA